MAECEIISLEELRVLINPDVPNRYKQEIIERAGRKLFHFSLHEHPSIYIYDLDPWSRISEQIADHVDHEYAVAIIEVLNDRRNFPNNSLVRRMRGTLSAITRKYHDIRVKNRHN